MIRVPFCYKIWGLSEDEEGNDCYGYIKICVCFEKKPSKERYNELHKKFSKLLSSNEDVELIDIQEYLDNTDCDEKES